MESGPEGSKLGEESKKSSTQTGRFQKTRGFATISGQDYEVALCCLFFLRAIRLTTDFFLASNHASAGKFDDVVMFYRMKEDQGPSYRTILLQAKHKENTAEKKLSSSSPFRLKEYLDSFKAIRNIWEQTVNVPNQQIHFQEISLVLYSNARCANGDTAHDVTASPDVKHLSDFLNTGGRLLRISDAQRAGLPDEPETSDFIQHLILCVEQMSVKKVDQVLQEEISNVLRLTSSDVAKKLITELKDMVKEWWQEEGEGRYLTTQSEEWRKVLEMQVLRLNADTLKVQKHLKLDFSEASLEEIKTILGRSQSWVSVRDKYHAMATRLRLLQALRSCLVLDAKFIESQFDEVDALWGTDVCPTLVLDVSGDLLDELSLLRRLKMAVSKHVTKKLVVISKEKPKCVEWFLLEAQATWSVLDPPTQERLLSVKVELQGKAVALRDVVGFERSPIMSDEVIHSICVVENGAMKLGESIPAQLEYYVPRCMQRLSDKKITYDRLYKTRTLIFSKHFFASKSIHLREIKSLLLYELRMLNHIGETMLITEECSDSIVRDLCCRFCVRGISDLGEKGLENSVMEFIPDTFICKEKVVVVEGVSGVGKSSFVTAMCSRVKERFPGSWVIRVDMGKHSDFIRERDFTNATDIRTFLLKGLKKDLHCLEQDLLDHSLYVTGNVFIFLDAFDEMSPNFTAKCCDLLKKIVTTVKYRQIVVTTRPITSKQVEEAVRTMAFHLPVFSADEQRLFLERFCKIKFKNFNNEEISDLHNSVGDVLEIPLLCKLAAEVLHNIDAHHLLKFLNPWKKVLLYQIFVKQSMNNRLAEKFSLDVSKPGVDNLLKLAAEDHFKDLQALALRKLDPFNQLLTRDISNKLPDEKFGLVVYNDESVEFEHHTFTEYFLGCWLARQWQECPKQLLLEIFSRGGLEFAVQTMSWFLFEDFPLHTAVAQGDVEAVRQLRSSGTTDRGGRSALHVAAMTEGKQDEVVDLLMTNDEATNQNDDIFFLEAVIFAEYFQNWEFLEAMVRNGKKLEGLNFIIDPNAAIQVLPQIIKKDLTNLFQYIIGVHEEIIYYIPFVKANTLLHVAAASNSTSIMKLITEKQHEANMQNEAGETPLHLAAAFGCKEAAIMLLEFGADPNIKITFGITALCLAVSFGHLEIVKLLIKNGANPNIINAYGATALLLAAGQGYLETVKLLLEKGAEANIRSEDGNTALIEAAGKGHLEIVQELLEKGADANIENDDGATACMEAAYRGHVEIVKLLLEKGVDPKTTSRDGHTALKLATQNCHLEVVKLLIEKGANPRIKDTTLMYAASGGCIELVKLLLHNRVDPSIMNTEGNTALMHAADGGHLEVVKLLLEKGVDPNIANKDGTTALVQAVNKDHLEVVKLLLEKGAKPKVEALMNATFGGCIEIVKLLLDKGVNPSIKYEDGVTTLMIPAFQGHVDIVKLLLEKGVHPNITNKDGETALMHAADGGHFEVVKLLLEKGADPNIRNKDGKTALMRSVDGGHLEMLKLLIEIGANPEINMEIVKLLLEKGADPNIRKKDGETALMQAADDGHLRVVKLLLDKGADPNIRKKDGETALMRAVIKCHVKVIKLLLKRGANPEIKGKYGETALMLAAVLGHLEVVKLLLEKGADPSIKCVNGSTALMCAGRNGHRNVVKLLIEYVRNIGSKA